MRVKRLWVLLLTFSVSAVLLLRVERGASDEVQTGPGENALRYLCIGDIAVTLGKESRASFTQELKSVLPFQEARKRCLPPGLPESGSRMRVTVTAPNSGYGASFEKVSAEPEHALAESVKELERIGWRETGGSELLRRLNEERPVRAFQREGAWLLATAVKASDDAGSFLLMAGEWSAAYFWR
jgi:hypothetical protein